MSKAENFTVRMDGDLKQRMKDHPEINWSHVIHEHVRSVLNDIERMNKLASDSQLSEADIDDLATMIAAAAADRAQKDRTTDDSETDIPRREPEEDESPQRRDVTDIDADAT